jgi:hypothetical protein
MTDDRSLIQELRSELDDLARRAPLANPDYPGLMRPLPVETPRRSPGAKVLVGALAACAVGVALVTGNHQPVNQQQTVTAGQPTSSAAPATAAPTRPGPVANPFGLGTAIPAGQGTLPAVGLNPTGLPQLLPGSAAELDTIVERSPSSAPAAVQSPFAQSFEGRPGPATPRLVIATSVAVQGALAGYARSGLPVTVGNAHGYLVVYDTHRQILWQEPTGVVVSLEALNIDSATLVAIAKAVRARPLGQPGVDIVGALPDGLAEVGSGTATTVASPPDGGSISVAFKQGGCLAMLEISHGSPADYEAVGIAAGNAQPTVVQGRPGLSINWGPGQGNLVTLLWSYSPGVTSRLQGECPNMPGIARDLRPVPAGAWSQAMNSVGPSGRVGRIVEGTPTVPTIPPSGPSDTHTFGVAH